MKNTIENNKLIAEFMGLELLGGNKYYIPQHSERRLLDKGFLNESDDFAPEQMHYHTSWEWLMPVVEKIGSIENKHGFTFSYSIHKRYTVIESSNYSLIENEIVGKGETSLEATYKAVVEFIKWYNEENRFICGVCGDNVNEYTYNEEKDVDECNKCNNENK